LFVEEITRGVDDGAGRLELRAGVIKVASSAEHLTEREVERFAAAALAQQQSGCPILTHTQGGRDAHEQVALLHASGACLSHVVLSHCDRNPDVSYHRDLLQTGVCLEYDQHFRQLRRGERCAAVELIAALSEDFPKQLLVGMDLARQRYWIGYGGTPGLAWLVTGLLPMLREAELTECRLHQISFENAVNAFAFTNCY
jgi:phosphotriesterase-related protein